MIEMMIKSDSDGENFANLVIVPGAETQADWIKLEINPTPTYECLREGQANLA